MTPSEKQLWERITAFQIDEENAAFTFSARLARENGWSREYTLKVIDEYKKFIFLCCISPTPVTPSDPVDQAWHLHLTYTRSYWVDFCQKTLGREIHHNPTKGGKSEKEKYNNCYDESHNLYLEKFGSTAPADIWQDGHTRFKEVNFRRINLHRYWLVKKPGIKLKALALQITALLLGCLFLQATGEGVVVIFFIVGLVIAFIYNNKNNNGKGGNNWNGEGDYSPSCGSDSSHSHNGCSSHGDSGCSGCSGCGGCGGD